MPPAQTGVDPARCIAQSNSPPASCSHRPLGVWIESQKPLMAEKFWQWVHLGSCPALDKEQDSQRESCLPASKRARQSVRLPTRYKVGRGQTVPGHLAQVALPKETGTTLGPNSSPNTTRRISGEALCSFLLPTCFSCSAPWGKELEKETQEVATAVWCPGEGAGLETTVRPALGRRAGWGTLGQPLSLGPTQLTGLFLRTTQEREEVPVYSPP